MIYFAGVVVALVFAVALDRFGLSRIGSEALETSRRSTALLGDGTLSDDEKEKAIRAASASLFGSFLAIGVRSAAALGLSLLVLLIFQITGLAPFDSVTNWLIEWEGIVLVSIVVVAWFLIRRSL